MAVLTAGTGGTYATLTLAQTAAVAGVDSIMMVSDITESFVLAKNIVSIYSDNGARVLNSTDNGIGFTISGLLTAECTLRDFVVNKLMGNGGTMEWLTVGAGSKLNLLNLTIKRDESSGTSFPLYYQNGTLSTVNQLTVGNCTFIANSKTEFGLRIFGEPNNITNSVLVYNTVFRGHVDSIGMRLGASTSNKVIRSYNNTFTGWNIANQFNGGTESWNDLYLNNTTDLSLLNLAVKGDFLNCGFGQQTDTGGWDSTIKFGLVTANELVNLAGNDFHLKRGAICVGVGKSISTITTDYYGVERPANHQLGIGAAMVQRRRF